MRRSTASGSAAATAACPALLGLTVACLVVTPLAGAEVRGHRPTHLRQSIDLRLAHPREADKLEALLPDPAVTRAPRKSVTDLVLIASTLLPMQTTIAGRLAGRRDAGYGDTQAGSADNSTPSDIDGALAAPNAVPPQARLYGVRLMAVVGGRLQHHASAVCGGWRDDRSLCRLACDGGRFEIARRLTADGPTFRLHVGGQDGIDDGLLVSSCDGSGTEVRLTPRGGQTGAEIVLQSE